MKTFEEVKSWMESKGAWNKFVIAFESLSEHKDIRSFIENFGVNSIIEAFMWDKTKDGSDYWNLLDNEFYYWYEGDELD